MGHRGASAYAPENTLEAFELAIKMGADGVELDVHLSRDGEIVVAHDERVDRVSNGSGLIKEMTLSEIKKLDFGVRFEAYRGAKAPTPGARYTSCFCPPASRSMWNSRPRISTIRASSKSAWIWPGKWA